MNSKYGQVFENVYFKDKTSIKIGGKIKYYIEVQNENCLVELIKDLSKEKIPFFILGNGTNILASDENFDVVVISLKKLSGLTIKDDLVIIEAGALNMVITKDILNYGYFPPYCISLVPGTIGGSIYMNASSSGDEIKDYLVRVDYLDSEGTKHSITDLSSFKYRYSPFQDNKVVILRGYFKFEKTKNKEELIKEKLKNKRETQPLDKYNMGSIFKNPPGYKAWKLIKDCNLEKTKIGQAKVSEKHANFVINEKNATYSDMISLIKYLKEQVYNQKGIVLDLEIKIIEPQDINPYH